MHSTSVLGATLGDLDDDDARRPSLLPGWSVGHVLTHVARNADGMVHLVAWALTGVPTPMYPSVEARAADIEAGERSAADLADDVRSSAVRLATAWAGWGRRPPRRGPPAAVRRAAAGSRPGPAREGARLRPAPEVEIHHVDLGLAYGPADWPADFVARTLLFLHRAPGRRRRGRPVGRAGLAPRTRPWSPGARPGRSDAGEPPDLVTRPCGASAP